MNYFANGNITTEVYYKSIIPIRYSACVLCILVVLICSTFEKLNSKNFYIEEFGFYSEVYLEPT